MNRGNRQHRRSCSENSNQFMNKPSASLAIDQKLQDSSSSIRRRHSGTLQVDTDIATTLISRIEANDGSQLLTFRLPNNASRQASKRPSIISLATVKEDLPFYQNQLENKSEASTFRYNMSVTNISRTTLPEDPLPPTSTIEFTCGKNLTIKTIDGKSGLKNDADHIIILNPMAKSDAPKRISCCRAIMIAIGILFLLFLIGGLVAYFLLKPAFPTFQLKSMTFLVRDKGGSFRPIEGASDILKRLGKTKFEKDALAEGERHGRQALASSDGTDSTTKPTEAIVGNIQNKTKNDFAMLAIVTVTNTNRYDIRVSAKNVQFDLMLFGGKTKVATAPAVALYNGPIADLVFPASATTDLKIEVPLLFQLGHYNLTTDVTTGKQAFSSAMDTDPHLNDFRALASTVVQSCVLQTRNLLITYEISDLKAMALGLTLELPKEIKPKGNGHTPCQ